jgi:hypothetical protein
LTGVNPNAIQEVVRNTIEAAKAAGITRATLQAWIAARRFRAPKLLIVKGVAQRLWTEADIARLKEYRAKHFGKGRGRKPKKK